MKKIFYKYRTDSDYTEAIFKTGHVYLSTAAKLNDPFECSFQDIPTDWMNEKVEVMQQSSIAGFLLQARQSLKGKFGFFGLPHNEIQAAIEHLQGFENLNNAYEFYLEFMRKTTGHTPTDCRRFFVTLDAQLDEVGIFSLSALYDHPLMWAHYASEHRGICLGFEQSPKSRMADPKHFLPVVYSDAVPEINPNGFETNLSFSVDENGRPYTPGVKISFQDRAFQKAVTTKSTAWSYEEEWRYIEPSGGSYDWPGKIVELTFGLKCPEARRAHYIKLAEAHVQNPVRLFEMHKKPGTSALERIPFEVRQTSPRQAPRPQSKPSGDYTTLDLKDFVLKMEECIRRKNYTEVIEQTEHNLIEHPDLLQLLALKGTAHGFAGQPEKAVECFTKITKAYPSYGQGWYQLSCALTQLKQDDKALKALREAFVFEPNDPSVVLNLGVHLSKQTATREEALGFLRRADQLGHRRARRLIADLEATRSKPKGRITMRH